MGADHIGWKDHHKGVLMAAKEISENKECRFVFMCPVVLKCRKAEIYTRKGSEQCPCRDHFKERLANA